MILLRHVSLVSHWKELRQNQKPQFITDCTSAPCCLNLFFKFSQILPGDYLRDARNESLLLRLCNVNFYSALKVNSCSFLVLLFIVDDICLSLKFGQQIISLMYNTWAS